MSLPVYLALTAAEFDRQSPLPEKAGFMACHFSPYSTGLSNLPRTLPEGSLLILNDRIPVCGHDKDVICRQLQEAVEEFGCDGVLLDFQRPGNSETTDIAKAVTEVLPCPVAVTESYAEALSCPVFLAPPLNIPLDKYITKWNGREVWLELGLSMQTITVTKDGSEFGPLLPAEEAEQYFEAEAQCCRYYINVYEDRVKFTLYQTKDTLKALLKKANALGIARAVGLFQELGNVIFDEPNSIFEHLL